MVAELDLVVTVCTVHAHLAPLVGTPTWVLLHDRPFWVWGHGPDQPSPWYPGARLFRPPGPGDWAGELAEVADALRGYEPRGPEA